MDFIKWGQKQVRQLALNLSDMEMRVEEATNNDPWGPHGSEMSKIADEALDTDKYREIMGVIARRLNDTGENWRHVYKALLLLEYLVKHGPMRVARDTQANATLLNQLQSFEFKDKNGRDQGLNVRNRAKQLKALVSDADAVTDAREIARMNRIKFIGASKDEVKFMSNFENNKSSSSSSTVQSFSQATPKRLVYEPKEQEEESADPFEATRKRIEQLKATEEKETLSQTATTTTMSTGQSGIKINLPQKHEPKKLSQVKVNPEIAATFMKIPQAMNTNTNNAKPASSTTEAATGIDLLGDLESTLDLAPTTQPVSFLSKDNAAEEWADFTSNQEPAASLSTLLTTDVSNVDPFAQLFDEKSVPIVNQTPSLEPLTSPVQKQPLSSSPMMNAFSLDATTSWTAQPMTNGNSKNTNACPMSGGGGGIGVISSNGGAIARGPGAPMNPNAVQPRRMTSKVDPFANLGF